MEKFFNSCFVLFKSSANDWLGFNFTWIDNILGKISEYLLDWKKQKSLSDKIGWIIGLIFDLWILWVIVIPIAIFFAEIDAFLEVMFAKIFLKIWFGLLPIITLFAVLDFALIFWRFCFRVPRFKKKKKLRRKLMFLLVVIASNIADHYYHDEIQSFISNDEAEVELEVETDTEVEITTVLEPEAEVK